MFKKGIFVVLTLFIKNIGWKIFFYKKKISTYLTKSPKELIILWKYENNIFILLFLRKIFTPQIAKMLFNFSYKSDNNSFYIYIIRKYIF